MCFPIDSAFPGIVITPDNQTIVLPHCIHSELDGAMGNYISKISDLMIYYLDLLKFGMYSRLSPVEFDHSFKRNLGDIINEILLLKY